MKRVWIFLQNTFATNTAGSHRKALILIEDLFAKLKAEAANDSFISTISQDFQAFYQAYQNVFTQKQSFQNLYEGYTLQFENIIGEMPQQLRTWESKIRAVFEEDTPEERMIFPNKRNPFLAGNYEERINAVKVLSTTISNFPDLQNAKTLVDAYYQRLEGARLSQQEKEGQNDKLSSELEKQRLLICTELYGILGRLMYHYRQNPTRIEDYFDLSLLRTATSTGSVTVFNGKVQDKSEVAIEGAVVVLPEIGYETATDNKGNFEMEVETGTFKVNVSASGFQTQVIENVDFVKDKPTEMTISLDKKST